MQPLVDACVIGLAQSVNPEKYASSFIDDRLVVGLSLGIELQGHPDIMLQLEGGSMMGVGATVNKDKKLMFWPRYLVLF